MGTRVYSSTNLLLAFLGLLFLLGADAAQRVPEPFQESGSPESRRPLPEYSLLLRAAAAVAASRDWVRFRAAIQKEKKEALTNDTAVRDVQRLLN